MYVYERYSVSKLKLYLTRQKFKMNKTLVYFEKSTVNTLIPVSFSLIEAP